MLDPFMRTGMLHPQGVETLLRYPLPPLVRWAPSLASTQKAGIASPASHHGTRALYGHMALP